MGRKLSQEESDKIRKLIRQVLEKVGFPKKDIGFKIHEFNITSSDPLWEYKKTTDGIEIWFHGVRKTFFLYRTNQFYFEIQLKDDQVRNTIGKLV